jgi:hypothetical protein
MAANAMIQACFMPPQQRQWLLDKTVRNIHHYQTRNARSRRSHRKRTIRKLHRIGITLRSLRRCDSG